MSPLPVICPQHLKTLSPECLAGLAGKLREDITQAVLAHGGHLASNLGVVELTLALHAMFESPKDKIFWDTGHQAYIHKALTGRHQGLMRSLRCEGGISGFPRREESAHDPFVAGHAGTSVSAALANSVADPSHYSIAVLGDGALTSGMVYEALNQAGALQPRRLMVILNDNGISIEATSGALARQKSYELLFKALGFRYLGPVDGHCIPELLEALRQAKGRPGPVALHVRTIKGRGHREAEEKPAAWHGVSGAGKAGPSWSDVFGEALIELAGQDRRIVAITAAMTSGTGLAEFAARFPERFFDVGICEQHAVTFAAGLAARGLRPVCALYSTFLQRGYDQVIHDVALQKLPVVFAVDRAGLVGADGETHQGVFDLAFLRTVPNMVISSPRDGDELRSMLYSAFRYQAPAVIRYPRGYTECRSRDFAVIEPGRAAVVAEGKDALAIALGPAVATAMAAREALAQQGVGLAVIDARFVKPLDRRLLLARMLKYKVICSIEDHALAGGFGSALLEMINDEAPASGIVLKRFGVQDQFVPCAGQERQRAVQGCGVQGIVDYIAGCVAIEPLRRIHAV